MATPPIEEAPAVVLIDLCGRAATDARALALADGTISPAEADYLALMETVTAQAELVNQAELNGIYMTRRGRLGPRHLRRMREIGAEIEEPHEAA